MSTVCGAIFGIRTPEANRGPVWSEENLMSKFRMNSADAQSDGNPNAQPWVGCPPNGRMLRPSQVFERTGLSKSQVYALIADGLFPPFVKLSARASAMPEAWLDCFISERARLAIAAAKA